MATQKFIGMLICVLSFSQSTFAQWEEEDQLYVLQSAESQPLKSISVYLDGRIKRTYHYDFYKRYLGFDQFGPKGQIIESKLLQYDENNFLIEETSVDERSLEKNTFYQYNQSEHLVYKEDCQTYLIRDSITNLATKIRSVRCSSSKIVLHEDQLPKEEYIEFDSLFWLIKKYFYDAGQVVKIEHYQYNKQIPLYFSIIEYNELGQKMNFYLQAGEVKKLNRSWTYDETGRVETIKKYSVQYGQHHVKRGNEYIPTGSPTILEDEKTRSEIKFRYDKKGRVSELENFVNGKSAMTLTFKYKAPEN